MLLALCAGSASAVIVHLAQRQDDQLPAAARRRRRRRARSAGVSCEPDLPRRPGDALEHQLRLLLGARAARRPTRPDYQAGVNRYLEDLAHDSGGDQNVDSVADAVQRRRRATSPTTTRTSAGALVDTDPYPGERLQKGRRSASPTRSCRPSSSSYVDSARPADATSRTSTSCSRRRASRDCFEARAANARPGSEPPALLRLPRQHSRSGGGAIVYANDPYVTGNRRLRRRRTPERQARPTGRSRAASATSTTSRSPTPN